MAVPVTLALMTGLRGRRQCVNGHRSMRARARETAAYTSDLKLPLEREDDFRRLLADTKVLALTTRRESSTTKSRGSAAMASAR